MSPNKEPDNLVFGNPFEDISEAEVRQNGTTPAYATHRARLDELRMRAPHKQERTNDLIAALTEVGTFDSRYAFLLRWFVLEILPAPSPDYWWEQVFQHMTP